MRLFLSKTSSYPLVFFDIPNGFLRLDGESMMANAQSFYEQLTQWLINHKSHLKPNTELTFRLTFINSASIKALYLLFKTLATHAVPLKIVLIQLSQAANEDVVEVLFEACRLLNLPCEVRKESET